MGLSASKKESRFMNLDQAPSRLRKSNIKRSRPAAFCGPGQTHPVLSVGLARCALRAAFSGVIRESQRLAPREFAASAFFRGLILSFLALMMSTRAGILDDLAKPQ